ncbi:MAG: hypothetical protein LBH55_04415 [Mycoplasmataceae bacterium]|jgi:hypothetical protein|nr:hypothetical protein [Mycoplasmataceae bacterium]
MKEELDKVVFRTYKKNGEVIALFPEAISRKDYSISCYCPMGEHFRADYDNIIRATRPASEKEYTPLLQLLQRCYGYKLRIMKRCRPKFHVIPPP